MKGLKIKLPMRKGSETSLTPKVLGKRKGRNMHSNNSPTFLGERAVSRRGSNAATLNQGNVSCFFLSCFFFFSFPFFFFLPFWSVFLLYLNMSYLCFFI